MRLAGPKPPNAFYSITWNAEGKKLILTKFRATDWSATFSYEQPEADALELRGSIDGKAISASLKHAAGQAIRAHDPRLSLDSGAPVQPLTTFHVSASSVTSRALPNSRPTKTTDVHYSLTARRLRCDE